jgi:hypothetical protein
VFFDSEVPLVPGDTNGVQDVYEWELDGVGSCRESGGCVFLLSGGKSPSASWFLDAGVSGGDVFIATRAELVAQDQNENFDVYDARVGGVEAHPGGGCSGAGCQGVPPAPPSFATPASVTYAGVGNLSPFPSEPPKPLVKPRPLTRAQKLAKALKACHAKHNARKRVLCEAHARKLYAASKAKKSARAKSLKVAG